MRTFIRLFIIVTFLFAPFPLVAAQRAADLAGHWEGAVTAGDQQVAVAFDVVKDTKGKLSGTFSGGPQGVTHLALTSVTLTARDVRLVVPGGDVGEAVFTGSIAPDGETLSGEVAFGGQSYPYTLKRTGPARPPADSSKDRLKPVPTF